MKRTTKDLETDSEETWTRLDVAASNLVMKCFRAMNEKRKDAAIRDLAASDGVHNVEFTTRTGHSLAGALENRKPLTEASGGCAHDAGEVERREATVRGFEK